MADEIIKGSVENDKIDTINDCAELDERLTPFVDGEDPPAVHRAVESHLGACPSCRTHAAAETTARDLVHDHRQVLRGEASDALRARCRALHAAASVQGSGSQALRPGFGARALRRWAPLSLAATIVLAVAGVFVFGLNNPVQALAASLTLDHVKCFTVGNTDPHMDSVVAASSWEREHGWEITVPNTLAAEQLTLVGVRHCLSSDGRAAHLMYTWHGTPLSLYVLPEDAGHAGAVRKMGKDAVIWCANRRTYAVVADSQATDLTRIVEYMKANAR